MDVSHNTFGSILTEGRNAAADALANCRSLRIEGGDCELKSSAVRGRQFEKS
jgi:predicted DNA-binding protein (UPF0251 family)